MDLGDKKRSEQFRIILTLDTVPDGLPGTVPQVKIDRQGTPVLTIQDMTVLTGDDLVWYYDYTTGASATEGAHQIQCSASIDNEPLYDYDNYVQTVANVDIVDGKIDTMSAVVDATKVVVDATKVVVDATKVVVDATKVVVDATKVDTTNIEAKSDTTIASLATKPTAGEIDTELSGTHGPTSWETGAGGGAGTNTIVINIKDDVSSANIEGVKISVHNNANDQTALAGEVLTNVSGNTINLMLDDSPVGEPYKVRISKPGYIIGEVQDMTITVDATVGLTVTTIVQPGSVDPDLNLLTISVDDISGVTQAADITITAETRDQLTKDANGNFITNASAGFAYNVTTEKWQLLVVIGARVDISSEAVWGLDSNNDPVKHTLTVPDETTSDVFDLIRSQST